MDTTNIPLFLVKLFNIAQDNQEHDIIRFDPTGKSLMVMDQDQLVDVVLPNYFSHKNLPSFLRQMNMYGFKKRKCGHILEFTHKFFRKDGRTLLGSIKRRNEIEQIEETPSELPLQVEDLKTKSIELHGLAQKIANQNVYMMMQSAINQQQLTECSQINYVRFKMLTDQLVGVIQRYKPTMSQQLIESIAYQQQQSVGSLEYMVEQQFFLSVTLCHSVPSWNEIIIIYVCFCGGSSILFTTKYPNFINTTPGWLNFYKILLGFKQFYFSSLNPIVPLFFEMDKIQFCPVLRPTSQEFENFNDYMEKIDRLYSSEFGMVKVIPPKNFKCRSLDYQKSIDNLVIQGPIEQNVYGKGGNYECLHIQKKSMLLKDYRIKQQEMDRQHANMSQDQLESLFWKSLAFSPPLYGADIKMSLMDQDNSWNLNNIHTLLNMGLQSKIPGVNEPYIYVGAWKSFFAWHKEDMDLYSTNYLHTGKDKFWYCIPEADSHYLEQYAKNQYADHFNKCSEYLRHKTTVINPYLLKEKFPQCRISKISHSQGEFMFLFGGAYHQGFNCGFNIAEAVNYATINWLPMLLKVKACKCLSDNVRIDQVQFAENLKKSKLKDNELVKQFCQQAKHSKGLLRKPIRKVPLRKH